jgi:uncharacterized surface anchored protein
MLVSNIRNMIAGTRYSLNATPTRFQLLWSQTVATILPASSAPPMIITGTTAAAKIAVRPTTEYQAAIAEIITEMNSIRYPKIMIVFTLGVY